MIEKINALLEEMKSDFRTYDGYKVIKYMGNMNFLQRTFNSQEECLQFVQSAHDRQLVKAATC